MILHQTLTWDGTSPSTIPVECLEKLVMLSMATMPETWWNTGLWGTWRGSYKSFHSWVAASALHHKMTRNRYELIWNWYFVCTKQTTAVGKTDWDILGGTSKPDPPKHGARSIPTRTRSESKLAPHQWQVLPTGQPDGKMAPSRGTQGIPWIQ